jgi:dienelactone hydrolase
MKKLIPLTLAFLLLLMTLPTIAAADGIKVIVGDQAIIFPDEQPYLDGEHVMLPIRQPAEALGLKVTFMKADKEVHLTAPAFDIGFKVGSNIASINGEATVAFGSAAVFQGNRVYVPLDFFKEVLRLEATYNASRYEVLITNQGASVETELPLPAGLVEEEVVIGEGTPYALPGTLTLPENATGPLSAVILVHGSGPSDRDETAFGYKPFRDIAWGLAEQGIAVLRYDKRTYVHAKSFTPEMLTTFTVKEETIEDAVAASNLLKKDKRINPSRVFVAGHSLGGMMAPRIDNEGGDFAGLIILAGTTRSLWEIIYDQNIPLIQALDDQDPAKKEYEALLAIELAKAKSIEAMTEAEAMNATAFSISAYYLRDMDIHSTTDLVAKLSKPLLILQGEDDFQVYADKDYTLWQELLKDKANATLKLYPGLNHFFVDYQGIGEGTIEEYKYPGHVDPQVIKDMAIWIDTQ